MEAFYIVTAFFLTYHTLFSFQNSSLESEEIMHILKPVEYNVLHYNRLELNGGVWGGVACMNVHLSRIGKGV